MTEHLDLGGHGYPWRAPQIPEAVEIRLTLARVAEEETAMRYLALRCDGPGDIWGVLRDYVAACHALMDAEAVAEEWCA